jgi:hypothetical protein
LEQHWQPELAFIEQDVFYQLMVKVVQAFVELERVDRFDYQSLQLDILAFSEQQKLQQEKLTQRYSDNAFGAEISARARAEVNTLVQQKITSKPLPFAAAKFIQEVWSDVLYVQAMNSGVNSTAWQASTHILDKLLATFKPAHEYQSRAEFLLLLPALLKALRNSLTEINMEKSLINDWFSQLEQAHKTLAGSIDGDVSDHVFNVLEIAKNTADTPQVDDGALVSEASEEAAAALKLEHDEKISALLDNISQGVWFNWNQPESSVRCQLAAIIKHTDKYIIVDRAGAKIAELLKRELATKLQTFEMEVIQSGSAFDKSLASVIDDIRATR